jgi:membrane protein required for colicin V production
MNLLDLGIAALLLLVTLRGYFRGLFQELAVLVGLVGGLLVASRTYLAVATLILPLINSIYWAQGLAFAVVLVAVYWVVRVLAYVLQRLLYHLYLDVLDRLLGAFFAFLKGCLILGLALLLLGVVLPKNSHLIKESRAHPLLVQLAKRTLDLLPPDFKQRAKDYLRSVPLPKEKKQGRDQERSSRAIMVGPGLKQACRQSGPDRTRTPGPGIVARMMLPKAKSWLVPGGENQQKIHEGASPKISSA